MPYIEIQMWNCKTPNHQPRNGTPILSTQSNTNTSSHSNTPSSLSPQSFSLRPECINYLICNYCADPFSDCVFSCGQHHEVKICGNCMRKKNSCFYCKREMLRNYQIEEILGMISFQCEVCGQAVRMSDLARHKKICGINRVHYCSYETGEQRCSFYTDTSNAIFDHFIESHQALELSSTNDILILPHTQIQFNLRDLEKPLKSIHSLPCFTSLYHVFLLNFLGTKLLFEFLYRTSTRSFLFILRAEKELNVQLQLLVPRLSVFGQSCCLQADQVEIREGNTITFASSPPFHIDQSDTIRSICAFELDVFEVFEKYSMIHGDCRFVQFGIKLHR